MTILTSSVHGAPPVFVMLNKATQLGTVRGGAGLVLTLTGEHVLLMAPGTKGNHQEGELKHYEEGYEEIQGWKEEERRNEKEQGGMERYYGGDYYVGRKRERKEDYESGDYSVGRKIEEKEYYENGDYSVGWNEGIKDYYHEESTTGSRLLGELEVASEDYESSSEDGSGEQQYAEESSTEGNDELTTESEIREGKSTRGNNNELGNDEKFQSYSKINGKYRTESKRKTVKLINSHKDIKDVEDDGSTATDTTYNISNKFVEAMRNDKIESVYFPEQIVIGYINMLQAERSKDQGVPSADGSQDESDATNAKTFTAHLKETEEVQLAPVVYHVSPKLLPAPTV
jgi:hypothetical protein